MSTNKRKQERVRETLSAARRAVAKTEADERRIEVLEARWQEYLEQIQVQAKRINELEDTVRTHGRATNAMRARKDRLIDTVAHKTQLISAVRAKLREKDADLIEVVSELDGLKRELAAIRRADGDAKKLRRRLATAKEQITEQNTKLSRLQRESSRAW